jgi:L-ascorbate metabolism protein UlaG (beta-lactamase superfamily)
MRVPATTRIPIALLSLMLAVGPFLLPAAASAQGGTVTMQWLGWSHYRFTSPTGKVLLTNPFVSSGSFSNPDSPIRLDDITKADIIVVADGHPDEVGNTVEIAQRTGATVVPPSFELGSWLIEKGVPSQQVIRPNQGERVRIGDITIRPVNAIHGSGVSPSDSVYYGGLAGGFVITFENGWTVYFSGSTAATQDQALWAEMYQPDLAILHMSAGHEPMDFAMQARLLMTGNPNLKDLFPHHHVLSTRPPQTTAAETQQALDRMRVPLRITEPFPGVEYTFTK